MEENDHLIILTAVARRYISLPAAAGQKPKLLDGVQKRCEVSVKVAKKNNVVSDT